MRNYYQSQIELINQSLINMGILLENAIENAIISLSTNDKSIIELTKQIELDVDKMEKDIEGLCLNVILHQQPVARDFHMVSSALKMITDMERIGDISDDIVTLSVMIKESRGSNVLRDIVKMGKLSVEMLKNSLDSYVNKNIEQAFDVCRKDDDVDSLFDTVKAEIIDMIKSEKNLADEAPDLLMTAKYFERIGDHCVNIAEWVIYAVTGKRKSNLDSSIQIEEAIQNIN